MPHRNMWSTAQEASRQGTVPEENNVSLRRQGLMDSHCSDGLLSGQISLSYTGRLPKATHLQRIKPFYVVILSELMGVR